MRTSANGFRSALLGGLVAVLAVALMAPPAQAKPKKVRVESEVLFGPIDIAPADGGFATLTFTGDVASRPVCTQLRPVHLEKTLGPGPMVDAGQDRTDAGGLWRISFSPLEPIQLFGTWEATVGRKIVRRRNGEVRKIFTCQRDVSTGLFDPA